MLDRIAQQVFKGTFDYCTNRQRVPNILAGLLEITAELNGLPGTKHITPKELMQSAEHLPRQVRLLNANPNQTDSIFKGLDSDEARRFYEGI